MIPVPDEFTRVRDGGSYGWPFCDPNPDTSSGLGADASGTAGTASTLSFKVIDTRNGKP